jgi:hypothetical protein
LKYNNLVDLIPIANPNIKTANPAGKLIGNGGNAGSIHLLSKN